MKYVYCLKCKMPIEIVRLALPKYSRVVDAIQPHTCQVVEEVEWQFPVNPAPTMPAGPSNPNDEIVKILNDLDDSIGDKRPTENIRKELATTAPPSLLKQMRGKND